MSCTVVTRFGGSCPERSASGKYCIHCEKLPPEGVSVISDARIIETLASILFGHMWAATFAMEVEIF